MDKRLSWRKAKVLEFELEQLFFFIMGPLGNFSPTFQKKDLKRVANASTDVLASSFNPIEYHHEIGPFSYFFYFLFSVASHVKPLK